MTQFRNNLKISSADCSEMRDAHAHAALTDTYVFTTKVGLQYDLTAKKWIATSDQNTGTLSQALNYDGK